MRILFDHGVPVPLRRALTGHSVSTAYELGWTEFDNSVLQGRRPDFDALVTTDKNLRYEQDLTGRRMAILVLPTTSWSRIQAHEARVVAAINALRPGDFTELSFP